MSEIIYNPKDVGKKFINSKGKSYKIRKYHSTDSELELGRKRWLFEVSDLDIEIRSKAGDKFFNPYRKGIYYYQVQTLFLLGANEWHSLPDIVNKLEEYTSTIPLKSSAMKNGYETAWDQFRGKSSRRDAVNTKDYLGRIQENYVMLQRLSRLHPYGYKLHQVCSAIDIKRESRQGFGSGSYSYRLSTYPTMSESFPIKDFSNFTFARHESKYISNKFIGTILTKNDVLTNYVPIVGID